MRFFPKPGLERRQQAVVVAGIPNFSAEAPAALRRIVSVGDELDEGAVVQKNAPVRTARQEMFRAGVRLNVVVYDWLLPAEKDLLLPSGKPRPLQ